MKLRRACCHPSLVMPDTELSSSKLQLFGEVLGDLLENRHKALVFNQFVGHLHIIRDYLDEDGDRLGVPKFVSYIQKFTVISPKLKF